MRGKSELLCLLIVMTSFGGAVAIFINPFIGLCTFIGIFLAWNERNS